MHKTIFKKINVCEPSFELIKSANAAPWLGMLCSGASGGGSHAKQLTRSLKMVMERSELNALHGQLSAEYQKGFPEVDKCGQLLEKLKVWNLINSYFISNQLNIGLFLLLILFRLDSLKLRICLRLEFLPSKLTCSLEVMFGSWELLFVGFLVTMMVFVLRGCAGDGCTAQCGGQGHPRFWAVHGAAQVLLFRLQVGFFIVTFYGWRFNHLLAFRSNFLPESSLKYQLLGMNLLCLLAQNRVSEFHTELELLSPQDIQSNTFIHYPVSLEQYLMEGCYNKVT